MPEIISKQCYFFFGAFHLVRKELTARMSEKIWVWWASEFGKGGESKLPTMMPSKYKHHGGNNPPFYYFRERERLKIPPTVSQQSKTEWTSKHIHHVRDVFSPDTGERQDSTVVDDPGASKLLV